jgi:hypothetical protein
VSLIHRLLPTYLPPAPFSAGRFITSPSELGFIIYGDSNSTANNRRERISFLKEQINPEKKPQVNWTFQIQIDAIMSVDDTEKIEAIITQKKALSKNSKDVYESEKIFSELDDLEWLQRQIARYS